MSEAQDKESKTEEPTQKRLQKAFDKGEFARSEEIGHTVALASLFIFLLLLAPYLFGKLSEDLTYYLEHIEDLRLDSGTTLQVFTRGLLSALAFVALPMAIAAVLGVIGSLMQTGWHPSTEKLKPSLNTLNPINGAKRLFNPTQQLVEMAKSVGKLLVVAVIGYFVMLPLFESVESFVGLSAERILPEIWHYVLLILIGVLIFMILIAIADFVYQYQKWHEKMKMTKQEVKEEHKQAEGDPTVKGRLRALRLEKARKRMMAAVPRADVVVTNPTHYAVALAYNPGSGGAPVVVAKGIDHIAMNIRHVAEHNGVPIVRNPPLARVLYDTVELDEEVPPEQYRAVAELISYVYRLKGKQTAA